MSTVVYLGNKQIQIIEGKINGRSVDVKKYYTLDAPEGSIINGIITDNESLSGFLEKTWKTNKLAMKNVILVIASTKFIGRKISLPKLSERKTLNFIAREYANVGGDEDQIYSYIPISKGSHNMFNIYAEGISPDFVREYIDLFDKIGVPLSAVYSDEGNLITFCKNTAARENKSFVFILADAMTFTTILWIDGAFYYYNSTRCFHEPGTEEYAEDIAHILSQLSQFMKANQVEAELETIKIAGVDPEDKILYADAIAELGLGAKVEIFKFATNGVSKQEAQKYLHAIAGLYSNGKSQNLLPQASATKKDKAQIAKEQEIMRIILPSLIALAIALVIIIALAFVKHDKDAKLEEINAYNTDPEVMMDTARYDALVSRNSFLSEQFHAIESVGDDITTYPCGNTKVLDVFETCALGLAEVECGLFDANEGTVSIVAKSDNVENINRFIKNLTEQKEFCGVDYTGYEYDDDGVWNIKVTCTLSEAAGR